MYGSLSHLRDGGTSRRAEGLHDGQPRMLFNTGLGQIHVRRTSNRVELRDAGAKRGGKLEPTAEPAFGRLGGWLNPMQV